MGCPVAKLARTGSRYGLFAKISRVAVHAGLGRRNAGETRILDRGVAVAAVDAVAADVSLVAELNRLFARDEGAGHPGRAVHFGEQSEQASDDEHRAEDADARDRVGAAMKDLRHVVLI